MKEQRAMAPDERVAQNIAVAGELAGELRAGRLVLEDLRRLFGDRKAAKMFSADLEDRKQMIEHLLTGTDDETIRLWSRELRRKNESLHALIRYHLLGASDACSWWTRARVEAPRVGRPRARQRRRVNARRGPPSREPDDPHDLAAAASRGRLAEAGAGMHDDVEQLARELTREAQLAALRGRMREVASELVAEGRPPTFEWVALGLQPCRYRDLEDAAAGLEDGVIAEWRTYASACPASAAA
jgi:hypothetical protein